LRELTCVDIKTDLLTDSSLLSIINSLSLSDNRIKEEKSLKDLNMAITHLSKLQEVRVIYLPPMTVAAIHIVNGEGSEQVSADILNEFINKVNLKCIYPAARNFGFNNPDGIPDNDPAHGYERWISIPNDMEVLEPLVKKHLDGGIYAAHTIQMGAWGEEWLRLHEWVGSSDCYYDFRWGTIDGVCGWLEEHLNYWNWYASNGTQQVDLMIPVKPKFAATTKHPQERIVDTFKYNGISVEVVEWSDTIWCGKIGYAENNTDEPNVENILNGFMALDIPAINERIEPDWDVCMSVNYFSKERPNGVMFGDLVGTEYQPDGFDVYKLPAGQYLRIEITDESAKSLGSEPWNGGIPPYEWVGEQLAPQFGYHYGNDRLPVFEYYGYYKPEKNSHEFRYLYVPVEKI